MCDRSGHKGPVLSGRRYLDDRARLIHAHPEPASTRQRMKLWVESSDTASDQRTSTSPSVGEQLPVDLYDSEKERRADAEQQRAVHRFQGA